MPGVLAPLVPELLLEPVVLGVVPEFEVPALVRSVEPVEVEASELGRPPMP